MCGRDIVAPVSETVENWRNLDCLFLLLGGGGLLGIYLRSTVVESRRAVHYLNIV